MRRLKSREQNLKAALLGTVKSAASLLPPLGQAVAGFDAYKRNAFERMVNGFISRLSDKVQDIEKFFRDDYFSTDDGRAFARKVVDASLDVQLEEKQEYFVNALVNAPKSTDLQDVQKLKYIDMLRELSLASLTVLAEIHRTYKNQVHGSGRSAKANAPFPQVSAPQIVSNLSPHIDPFLVAACITEMRSHGLFENVGEWKKGPLGHHSVGGGFATAMCYTHFDARFVEFITVPDDPGSEN